MARVENEPDSPFLQRALTKGLDEIHGLLVAEEDVDSALRVVAEIAVRTIEGCDCAGVTLVEDDRVMSTACTDPICAGIDGDQYEAGEGPCVDAIRTNSMMLLQDASSDERWPHFGPLAERHGVSSALGFPLEVRGTVLGALNLYGRQPEAFVKGDVELGDLLATHAAVVLANVKAFDDSSRRAEQLTQALESRGIIERAKGILIEREKCSEDEAFRMLVRASQTLNRKLHAVAADVVEDARGPNDNPEAGSGKL